MATAVATFLLLIAGGLVTSTDSGLAVPDWPLSYGTWFPPMVGGIRYEHGHRMIAAFVGLMIAWLAGWVRRVESRRWVRRLGYGALGGVILQGLLGGLTVLLLLPPPVSIAHACLGPTVFCLVVGLAACTSPRWEELSATVEDHGVPSLRTLSLAVASLAAAQLVFGAVLRHTGLRLWPHVTAAGFLVGAVGWCLVRLRGMAAVPVGSRRVAWRLATLLIVQVALGVLALRHRDHVVIATAHVGIGALILAQSVVFAWRIARSTMTVRIGARMPVAVTRSS